ncbi:N-acetyl-alpha-D-glucosaminyl L-malate synthase BshA [candidate division KSB1 bacterium]|nr:N-acetyl-alpha-D-glucosaminyl L-malate synthase BshA [candidate division KSB1 bacterium]
MNIGIVCYPTHGGSGVVASELGLALADRGHNVHFFSTARPFRLPGFKPNVFFHEVPVVHYSLFEHTPYTLTISSTLYEAAELHGLDVIHAHYAIPHAAAALMAKQMGGGRPPIVTTLHGTDITLVGSHPAYLPTVRWAINESDAVTAVSQHLAAETHQRLGVTREIDVVYNFVDGAIYRRQPCSVERKLFSLAGEPLIMHISNFRPVKRIGDLIEAFIKVRKQAKCRMLLVGDGPERTRAEQDARRAGVLGDVVFLGNQVAVNELLGIADIYFLPSENESFGLSALEAMASEAPVVATKIGGLPEVVKEGETGFLCDLGDTDTMAARILQLVEDGELRRTMGQAARRRALTEFPQDKIVPQYEAVYSRIAKG